MTNIKFGDALYIKGRIGWQRLSKSEYLKTGDYYLITGVDIDDNHLIDYDSCYYVSKERYEQDPFIQLHNGDIILTKDGTIGKVGIIENLKKPATLNSHLFLIRNKIPNILDTKYLFYILCSQAFQKFASANTGGSNIPAFTQKNISEFEIDLPSLTAQKKAVRVLETIDRKIINNDYLSSQLESLAKTIYDYWFLQFNFPDENGRPYKSSGGKMVWNEELKREIPEGWKITSVGDITINHDSERIPVKNTDRDSMKGDIPYYGATGIMGYVNRPIFDGDYVLLAEDGSVMDENGRPIIQRITGKTWVNNHAHVLEPKNGYHCRLLMMMLKQIPVVMIKTGSIQMKINQENMNKYHVLDLPQSIKEKTNIVLDNIDAQLLQIERENRQLSSLRDFLLPMLMNGQITFKGVPNA